MGHRAALFDLDGTLLDTAPDLVGALNVLRREEGLAEAPVADFRAYVSQGSLGLIRAGLPPADEAQESRWRQRFLDWYERNMLRATQPFQGVEGLLDELDRRAIPWAVVTNKPEFLTLPLLAQLGWKGRAGCVICGDTLTTAKPHPAPVLLACELLGVEPAAAIMVGDDPRDMEAAEAAGTTPVLMSYGYGVQAALTAALPPAHVLDQPAEILRLFANVS